MAKRGVSLFLGGWHCEKYFLPVEAEVRNSFKFDFDKLNEYSKSILREIDRFNSVSIHIRREDYLSEENYNVFGCVTSIEYYKKAIDYIKQKVDSPVFFIFTNDYDWVVNNFNQQEFRIITGNVAEDSWKDMCLMSRCKHNINTNSTFSWWAAWLNSNSNKIVICPKEFIHNLETKDFYPQNWTKI